MGSEVFRGSRRSAGLSCNAPARGRRPLPGLLPGLLLAILILAPAGMLRPQAVYEPPGRPPERSRAGAGGNDRVGERPLAPERLRRALDDFRSRFGAGAEALFLPGENHPALLHGFRFTGGPPFRGIERGGSPESAAGRVLAFIEAARDLAGIGPEDSLVLESSHGLEGNAVVRLAQRHRGLPVLGAGAAVHLDAGGAAVGLLLDLRRGIAVDPAPAVTEAAALAAALRRLGGDPDAAPARSRLGTARVAGRDRLVWDLRIRARGRPFRVLVDAHSGAVLGSASLLRSLDCSPRPRGDAYPESPAKGTPEEVEILDLDCRSSVLDGEFIRSFTWTGTNPFTLDPVFAFGLRGTPTPAGVRFNASGNRELAQVTAFHHATRFHGWFKGLGFHLLDRPFPAVANVADCFGLVPCDNAFYDPLYPYATGFGILILGTTPEVNYALEADVICHEYTHAVVEETTGLGNDFWDPGFFYSLALNEAFADYFSCAFVGDPQLGEYSGRAIQQSPLRNLENSRRWPTGIDPFSEHDTGLIWGGALWDIRSALSRDGADAAGARTADRLAYATLVSLPSNADFLRAAGAMLSAAQAMGLSQAEQLTVRGTLAARGLTFSGGEPPLVVERLPPGGEAAGEIAAVTSGSARMASIQYEVQVPEQGSRLLLELSGSGEIDLYVRFNNIVTPSGDSFLASFRSESPGAAETIDIQPQSSPPLTPGSWFVAVANRSGSIASYRLRAAVELKNFDAIQPLAAGETLAGAIPGGPAFARVQYAIEVPSSIRKRLAVTLSGDRDVQLYLRLGKPVEIGVEGRILADAAIATPAAVESLSLDAWTVPPLRAGRYYLAVQNATALPVNYTLKGEILDAVLPPEEDVALAAGASRTGFLTAADPGLGRLGALQYRVAVPANAILLAARLRSSRELGLLVRAGERVGFTDGRLMFDFSSDLPGGDETVAVDPFTAPPLAEGVYYLAVLSRDPTPADYRIEVEIVTADSAASIRDLPHGIWTAVVAEADPAGAGPLLSATQYRITVSAAAPGIDVLTLPQGPGNVDLYLRHGRPVQWIDGAVVADHHAETSRGAEAITVFLRDAAPGTYLIGLVNRGRSDVPLELLAVHEGVLPLSVPVENGDLFEGVISPAPGPGSCRLTLDQFVIEVPANALRLELVVEPLTSGPLEVLTRFGSRILIDLGDAIFDAQRTTAGGLIVFSGTDLRPGTFYVAISNCLPSEQRYEFSIRLRLPGLPEEPLSDGLFTEDIVEPPPAGATARLHSTQYFIDVTPGTAELAAAAWGGECASEDIDLLVSIGRPVALNPDGTSNAQWRSEVRGPGAETAVINLRSVPRLAAGRYYLAILNRENARVPVRVGARTFGAESAQVPPGSPRTDTVPTAGVPGIGLILDRQFRVDVFPGADRLRADLAPAGDPRLDIDLIARFGLPVIIGPDGFPVADQISDGFTGIEAVAFPAAGDCLRPGAYYLAVANFAPVNVPFSLTPSVEGRPCFPVFPGDTAGGEAAAAAGGLAPPVLQHCMDVPAGSPGFQVELTAQGAGDLDLFARTGIPVEFTGNLATADFASQDPAGTEWISIPRSRIVPGKYFIAVGSRAPSKVPFALAVRPLQEAERSIGWGETVEGAAPGSGGEGIGWLAPEQFRVTVPAGVRQLTVALEVGAPGSRLDLHVRRGSRIEAAGRTAEDNGSAAGPELVKRVVIPAPAAGAWFIAVRNFRPRSEPFRISAGEGGARIIRGDSDENGLLDITDAVALLAHLFLGEAPVCSESADADGSGGLDVTDAVYLLTHLFLGGPSPPAPFPACGPAPAGAAACTGAGCR